MKWLLAAATLTALALSAALAIRTFKTPPVAISASAPQAVRACPDRDLRPAPVLAESTAAPLQLVVAPAVKLLIDGAEPGSSLLEGVHEIVASSTGAKTTKLKLQVEAFTPVLL